MKNTKVTILALLVISSFAQVAAGQACHAADSVSTDILAELNGLMTADDTVRTSLQLPLATSSQIALITNETTCDRARQAVDSAVHATNPIAPATLPARPLYLASVGAYFAIVDPMAHTGEWHPMYFFDGNWNYVNSLIGWR